ncbi:hypothetical protein D9M70_442570 [compost metagenome]
MAVPVDRRRRQQQRQQAELQHRRGAVGDIANLLGEANDLDLKLAVFEPLANLLLQDLVVRDVVQVRPRGVELVELSGDHCAALVAGDQGANGTALGSGVGDPADDLGVQAFGGHCARHQRIGTKAFLGDLVDEGVGRPQRLHAAARDAGQECHCLGDVIQTL